VPCRPSVRFFVQGFEVEKQKDVKNKLSVNVSEGKRCANFSS